MKRATNLLFSFGIIAILSGCFEKVEFPTTPNVEFLDLRFFDRPESFRTDSLVISFRFEDGDNDLGLNSTTDVLPPYHDFFVYLDSRDSVLTISNMDEMVPPFFIAPVSKTNFEIVGFSGGTFFIDASTQTSFNIYELQKQPFNEEVVLESYSCAAYDIVNIPAVLNRFQNGSLALPGLDILSDTLPIIRNPRRFNIHIDILRKNLDGSFEEFFLASGAVENCGVGELDARFPVFGDGTGKEGIIHYQNTSSQYVLGFQDGTYKLNFFIYDRTGNKSNVAESFEFTLADITQ